VESHLQNQRSAIKMLHERILILLKYVTDVIAGKIFFSSPEAQAFICAPGQSRPDHGILRSVAALVASLPASENKHFREEFDTVCPIPVISQRHP